MASIPGVEIFARGVHRGKIYTAKDLKDITANFRDFSSGDEPLLRNPAVMGHEEKQEWLDRTDLPAAGWAERVDVSPDGKLIADLGDVPEEVADLIDGKVYRTVSAEIYDAPPEGVPGPRPVIVQWLVKRGIDPDSALREAEQWAPGEQQRLTERRRREIAAGKSEEEATKVPPLDTLVDARLRSRLGKMLRRVAFLGGEIPQVKSLKDIPRPRRFSELAERRTRKPTSIQLIDIRPAPTPGVWAVFSELTTHAGDTAAEASMSREEIIQKIGELGGETDLFQGLGDDVLAEILRLTEAQHAQASADAADAADPDAAAPTDGDQQMADGEPDADDKPTTEVVGDDAATDHADGEPDADDAPQEGYAEDGQPIDSDPQKMASRARKMSARAAKMMSRYCGDNDGATRVEAHAADDEVSIMTKTPEKMSELRKLIRGEVKGVLKEEVSGHVTQLTKFMETQQASSKKAAVEKFVEARVAEGKITPAQRESVASRLLRADSSAAVHKFSEGGKTVQLTELDLQMKEIEAGPVLVKFSERVKAGAAGAAGTSEDAEVAKVEQHFESFAEQFTRLDPSAGGDRETAKKNMVESFKTYRKAKGGRLTAAEYLDGAAA